MPGSHDFIVPDVFDPYGSSTATVHADSQVVDHGVTPCNGQNFVSWSTTNRLACFPTGGTVTTMKPDGSVPRTIDVCGAGTIFSGGAKVAWSPNGTYLLVGCTEPGGAISHLVDVEETPNAAPHELTDFTWDPTDHSSVTFPQTWH